MRKKLLQDDKILWNMRIAPKLKLLLQQQANKYNCGNLTEYLCERLLCVHVDEIAEIIDTNDNAFAVKKIKDRIIETMGIYSKLKNMQL